MSQTELFPVDETKICPVRGEFHPCDPAELDPLLAHLSQGEALTETQTFPRGTLLTDGRLDLCKQNIGPAGAARLAEDITELPHVKHLLLGANGIGSAGAEKVAQVAAQNESLETLYLGCNLIDETGTVALTESLEDHPGIKAFWIKRNPIGLRGAEAVVKLLRRNPRLRTLDLVHTDLTAEGVELVIRTLRQEPLPLEQLYLGGNQIGPAAAEDFAELLRRNTAIKGLFLSVNQFGDEGAKRLAVGLRENRTLEALSLSSNDLGPAGAWEIAQALKSHPTLRLLDLGYDKSTRVLGEVGNHIGDRGAEALADLLTANHQLQTLLLTRNGITDDGANALRRALVQHPNLTTLTIGKEIRPALRADIRELLARNRMAQPEPLTHPDVLAIRSVYRTSPAGDQKV